MHIVEKSIIGIILMSLVVFIASIVYVGYTVNKYGGVEKTIVAMCKSVKNFKAQIEKED